MISGGEAQPQDHLQGRRVVHGRPVGGRAGGGGGGERGGQPHHELFPQPAGPQRVRLAPPGADGGAGQVAAQVAGGAARRPHPRQMSVRPGRRPAEPRLPPHAPGVGAAALPRAPHRRPAGPGAGAGRERARAESGRPLAEPVPLGHLPKDVPGEGAAAAQRPAAGRQPEDDDGQERQRRHVGWPAGVVRLAAQHAQCDASGLRVRTRRVAVGPLPAQHHPVARLHRLRFQRHLRCRPGV